MRDKMIIPCILAGIILVGAWFLSRSPEEIGNTVSVPGELAVDSSQDAGAARMAPGFELNEITSDKLISLEDYRGKVVLLDFWATWCRPCRMEIPHFVDLKNELGDDFEIIGISVDRQPGVVEPFKAEWKINYPIVVDAGPVSMAYGGIRSIPTSFLIDRQGNIVETFVGYRPKQVFEQAIKKALAKS